MEERGVTWKRGYPPEKRFPQAETADLLTGSPACPIGEVQEGQRGTQLLERVVITDLKPMGKKRGVVGDARL